MFAETHQIYNFYKEKVLLKYTPNTTPRKGTHLKKLLCYYELDVFMLDLYVLACLVLLFIYVVFFVYY